VTNKTLILIAPGTYSQNNFKLARINGRQLGFVGFGGRPVLNATHNDGALVANGVNGKLFAENIELIPRINSGSCGSSALDDQCDVLFHNVLLDHSAGVGTHGFRPPGGNPTRVNFTFNHCTFLKMLSNSSGQFYFGDLNRVSVSKCFFQNFRNHQTLGWFASADYVTSENVNYGIETGGQQLNITDYLAIINSRVIDLAGGAAKRVVVFDWLVPDIFYSPEIDSDGNWGGVHVIKNRPFGIYYLSDREIYPPMVHGPYTAT
jgi:hypothetical protein